MVKKAPERNIDEDVTRRGVRARQTAAAMRIWPETLVDDTDAVEH